MAKSESTGGKPNKNTPAEVNPTSKKMPMQGLNGPAMTVPSKPFGETTSKEIHNMVYTLMEMPDGRGVNK